MDVVGALFIIFVVVIEICVLSIFFDLSDTPEQINTINAKICDNLQKKGIEQSTRYDTEYGCLVKRGDHWEKSKW